MRGELNLTVEVGPLLDAGVYELLPGRRVPVLAYGCFAGEVGRVAYSDEHTGVGSLGSDALWETEPLAGYVRGWAGMARIDRSGF